MHADKKSLFVWPSHTVICRTPACNQENAVYSLEERFINKSLSRLLADSLAWGETWRHFGSLFFFLLLLLLRHYCCLQSYWDGVTVTQWRLCLNISAVKLSHPHGNQTGWVTVQAGRENQASVVPLRKSHRSKDTCLLRRPDSWTNLHELLWSVWFKLKNY